MILILHSVRSICYTHYSRLRINRFGEDVLGFWLNLDVGRSKLSQVATLCVWSKRLPGKKLSIRSKSHFPSITALQFAWENNANGRPCLHKLQEKQYNPLRRSNFQPGNPHHATQKKILLNSFSARYNCDKLVYYKWFDTIIEAINEEKRIKAGSRAQKKS